MSANELLLLGITGICAGLIAGTMGVGGGIIIIPFFIYFLGLTQHQAQGTSLALMLPPIGLVAAFNYYKEGYVNIKYALIVAAFFIIGSYLGSLIAISMPDKILKKVFGAIVLITGIKMVLGK